MYCLCILVSDSDFTIEFQIWPGKIVNYALQLEVIDGWRERVHVWVVGRRVGRCMRMCVRAGRRVCVYVHGRAGGSMLFSACLGCVGNVVVASF